MKKTSKNLIGSFIIISILVMPFSNFIPKTNAQTYYSGSGYSSASGYISDLSPIIKKLPGCKNAMKSGIENLFSGSGAGGSSASGDDYGPAGVGEAGSAGLAEDASSTLESVGTEAGAAASSVPTYDQSANKKLDAQSAQIKKLVAESVNIKKSTSSIEKNDSCLNTIGKAVVNILIQKLTLSIVDWIKTGNAGGPLFVQNPGKFLKDIAKSEILGFNLEINDPVKFPFGKAFIQNVAIGFNNKFADNAQYSLDKMIQDTNPEFSAASFSADFSQGGWSAWRALTQIPANNPLGFQLMASNELGARLEGTSQSTAEIMQNELQQSGGFLSPQVCVDPEGVTKEENDAALAGGGESGGARLCKKWVTTTPGAVIADKLTTTLGYNDNALLSAETLNDAIAAILDATMARFSSELINKGLAGISGTNEISNNADLGTYFNGTSNVSSGTQFASSYKTQWIQNNPNFNLEKDVTQAFIDEQRIYLEKLDLYNIALKDLIKWIRQLDYCIPGPNPNWEEAVANQINNLGSSTVTPKQNFLNSTLVTDVLPALSPLGGPVGSLLQSLGNIVMDEDAQKNIKIAYASFLTNLLGVTIYDGQDQVTNMAGVSNVLNSVFNSYRNVINKIYFSPNVWGPVNWSGINYMPGVTLEARAKFQKISGYMQIIEDNTTEKTFKASIIKRLENFKQKVDSGEISSEDLNDPSSSAVTEFARLSGYFISGDDIADIDNLYKQTSDERDYVEHSLVGTPINAGDPRTVGSCEYDMANLWNMVSDTDGNNVGDVRNRVIYYTYAGRQPYPFEIDHFYSPVKWSYGPFFTWNEPNKGLYTNGSYIKWTKSLSDDLIKNGWLNEGFLYGSHYFNNTNVYGGSSDDYFEIDATFKCGGYFISDVTLSAGSPTDIGFSNNKCGTVLQFERKFGVY